MDQIHSQPLDDWLPNSAQKSSRHGQGSEPRHLDARSLTSRPEAAWPISEGVLASLQRSAERTHNAAWGYAYGQPDRLIELARRAAGERPNFLAPVHVIERVMRDVLDGEISDDTRRAVIATLAQQLPRTMDRSLPRSVLELYPQAMTVLADFLENGAVYDKDLFAKDLRFVCGATVPAGAQAVDVLFSPSTWARLSRARRTIGTLGRLVYAGDTRRAAELLAKGGTGEWLQIHTDIRNVADFNPQGWDRCYHRISHILAQRPRTAGMLGVSWFYDPRLRDISPRLNYLQDRPLQNGAFLVRLKAGPIHSQRAATTSPTRRKMIASGAYTPVCYALFWPRREMLEWASRLEMGMPERAIAGLSDAA